MSPGVGRGVLPMWRHWVDWRNGLRGRDDMHLSESVLLPMSPAYYDFQLHYDIVFNHHSGSNFYLDFQLHYAIFFNHHSGSNFYLDFNRLKGLNLLAKANNRYFGTACDGIWDNTDEVYLALAGNYSEFGMMTPGNAMKFDATEPEQDTFVYTDADYTVSWSHNRSQVVRGHNFVWYNQVPYWLSSGNWTNVTLISILENHIQNVAGHYRGELYCWDVINEPFNDDGTWRADLWYNTIGSAFVPIALSAARAADPNAKLYINDYNIETIGAKSNAHLALAESMLNSSIPLDGIGCQGHLIVGEAPSASSITANFARFAALGLEWALTGVCHKLVDATIGLSHFTTIAELDIRMTLPETTALLSQQASDYVNAVGGCLASPACVGISTWDTSDDYSWIPSVFTGQGDALLFDSNKQPKPAYFSVASALASATVTGHYTAPTASTTTGTASSTITSTVSLTSTSTVSSSTASATVTVLPLRGLNLLAKANSRYFGTANDGIWDNTDIPYLTLSGNSSEFGMVTPGNAMKFDATEPEQDTFVYTDADYTVSWAHNNSQAVRGHNFVWYNQDVMGLEYIVPYWLSSGNWTNATLISILENHIQNVAGHYRGELYCWDVINEPFNDDGTWRADLWYNTIGPAFVPIALTAARAADPNVKLYINDYNIETIGAKSNAHLTLAQSLLNSSVPLDGIGCQGHLIVGEAPSASSITANFARFAALGLEWAITELDIRMTLPETTALLTQQASDYANAVGGCVASAACVGITTWDTSDDYSWIPSVFSGQGDALLFDSNKQPKPAYYSVANTLAAATVQSHFTSFYTA
ncbi:hypothetical protein FRB96_002335 [Tulasnella sp. 330]|nr:hypothetical protein FRB96_002335 [Tulasnella sp. 330]